MGRRGWDGQKGRERAERSRLAMALQEDSPPCHAERSEAPRRPSSETLRYAQGDKTEAIETDTSLRSG